MFLHCVASVMFEYVCVYVNFQLISLGGCDGQNLGRRRRLSALFGRVGKAARRQSLLMSASFFPSSSSTPRQATSSLKQRPPDSSSLSSDTASAATPRLQRTTSGGTTGNARDDALSEQSKIWLTSESLKNSSEFRVPVAPPRNRTRQNRAVSLNSLSVKQKRWFFFYYPFFGYCDFYYSFCLRA